MSDTAVFGIYAAMPDMEKAVEAMKTAGFQNSDISVLCSNGNQVVDCADGNSAPAGAAAGVMSGALAGGTLGWLAGIGQLAIPGVGPFIAAGPIMAALAGIGAGGLAGGLAGALIGLGIPKAQARTIRRPHQDWSDPTVGTQQ